MFGNGPRELADFRSDFAKTADFGEVFERDMKPLYLLAFLLTANHQQAEQCFASTVEEAFKENGVFKACAASWLKRCLIKKAIQVVFSCSTESNEERSLWHNDPEQARLGDLVNALTGLKASERFVYVMSVLERYSTKDCSLLLNYRMETVIHLRVRAACKLAAADPFALGKVARPFSRRESA
jgi:DNA-directed RNA polymerase specialized sigma24 family protein